MINLQPENKKREEVFLVKHSERDISFCQWSNHLNSPKSPTELAVSSVYVISSDAFFFQNGKLQ